MPADFLEALNSAQRQAAESIEGPLLVVAGPGSGKTRVITHRIAYLVHTCGVRPFRIMAVTFTNKAARELQQRLGGLLGRDTTDLALGTFHSQCARLLRVEADAAGLDRSFAIYDADDQISLVRRVMKEVDIDPKRFSPGVIRSAISGAKAKLQDPVRFASMKANYFDEVVLRVYERYQHLLAQGSALDFDDLLMNAVRLLESNADVLSKYQQRYVHVMVDEFQDTSMVQYRLARLLAGAHQNLCVVGDPDQSIYSWRFAEVGNILDFAQDYPDAEVVVLEQNYRSTQNILDAATGVIVRNGGRDRKKLWTDNPKGPPITVADALDEQDEALFVADQIEQQVNAMGKRYGDFAVLYRTNAQSRPLEECFLRYGLPYRLVGALRFYERREIKDTLSYLRLIHNPYDDVSLQRVINVPARGIGQRTMDEIRRWASLQDLPIYAVLQLVAAGEETLGLEVNARTTRSLVAFVELIDGIAEDGKGDTLADLFDVILRRTGYSDHLLSLDERGEDRLENVMELRGVAIDFAHLDAAEALTSFLEQVALVSETDDLDQRANSVTLITLHQAKGLEFPVVFMVGMEENVLPHHRSKDDPSQMEEERRLCYVGMTRAQEMLYLLRAYRRIAMGQRGANAPSRFLADVPGHLTRPAYQRKANNRPTMKMMPKMGEDLVSGLDRRTRSIERAVELPLPFSPGDRILHDVFGDGVVVSCDPSGGDHQVTAVFKGGVGVKRLLNSLANLEKL